MDTRSNNFIHISKPIQGIQGLIDSGASWLTAGDKAPSYPLFYTQNEDFFIRLKEPFTVPRFPVHHAIDSPTPEKAYLAAIGTLLTGLIRLAPELFAGLTYFFDPEDIFHPGFYRLIDCRGMSFLYLFRLDLGLKTHYSDIAERGTNDLSHSFSGSALFCDALLIPLGEVIARPGGDADCVVNELVSETWIGETGRGYRVKGIWIDDDLSRFFTRLFISPGKRLFPLYPFVCRHKTVCGTVIDFTPAAVDSLASPLKNAVEVLQPEIREIESVLRQNRYSDDLPVLQRLKKKIDTSLYSGWDAVIVETYPNQQGNREYRITQGSG